MAELFKLTYEAVNSLLESDEYRIYKDYAIDIMLMANTLADDTKERSPFTDGAVFGMAMVIGTHAETSADHVLKFVNQIVKRVKERMNG